MIKDRKLQINIVTLLLLCIGLCIASFAIAYVTISYDVKNNYFHTGVIDIDLNGDKPIIGYDEEDKNLYFAPGTTVTKEFYIRNNGSGDVFYKLYFEGIEGDLADVLEIEIYKKDPQKTVLLEGTIKNSELKIADELKAGHTQNLFAQFHWPESADDDRYKGGVLKFDISALAVQTKNNDPINPKFE
ncbi:MAG: hypothetical protein IJ423_00475 [Clostridia bacterium]|nr:hypothetical protein [Clostridia bacterium]